MKYFRHKRGVIDIDSIAAVMAIPYSGKIEQYCVVLKHATISTGGGGQSEKIETPMASVTMTDLEDGEKLLDILESLNE